MSGTTDAMDRLRAARRNYKNRMPYVWFTDAEAIVSDLEASRNYWRNARKEEISLDLALLTEEVQVGAEVIAGLTAEVERLRAEIGAASTALIEALRPEHEIKVDSAGHPYCSCHGWDTIVVHESNVREHGYHLAEIAHNAIRAAALAGEAEEGT